MQHCRNMQRAAALLGLVTISLVVAGAATASAQERTYTFRTKAVSIGGYQVKNDRHPVSHPSIDGFITDMSARVVDRAGKPMPVKRMMLHHLVFHNYGSKPGQYSSTCNSRAEPFFGTGEEHQTMDLPPGYGYRMRVKDKWALTWMLMNHTPKLDVGYIEYRITVETSPLTAVRPFWLRTIGCKRDPIFNVPGGGANGSTYEHTKPWTVPQNGRLIAGGGHLHGGAKSFVLSQPRCGNRALIDSKPLYGLPDNPVYNVLPVLHEPGPINTGWMTSRAGIPVIKGDQLKLTAGYDGELPHTRVMAIMHIYIAPDEGVAKHCAPMPADVQTLRANVPGREEPPLMRVPLTGIGPDGLARTIEQPPGRLKTVDSSLTVDVKGFSYRWANLSVPAGATVKWHFGDSALHDVTLANGPRGFASQHYRKGGSFKQTLTTPGEYRLFCSLHPVRMRQKVTVRAP